MKMNIKVIGSLVIAVSAVVLSSCSSDPDSAGLEYMPDMYRSPAVEPYVDYGHVRENENVDAKMRLSAMTPPHGSVPYYGTDSVEVSLMLPYHRKANVSFRETHGMFGEDLAPAGEDTYAMAAADRNPMALPKGEESLKTFFSDAKTLYTNNCSHCHGEKGDGNGEMMVNGKFAGVPDYNGLTVSDGQMFYSIYYGKGSMGSHRSILNKKEIWTLVHYIRTFQNADYGVNGNTDMGSPVVGDSIPTPGNI
jgi:mono/diheme cytochrome c family protein